MDRVTPRTILHVDINSYFATLLQQENPHLRGRPLGILKSAGRTCLIAVSKEAKTKGAWSGCSLAEGLARCPDLIALPAEFNRYLDATRRLHRMFQQFCPSLFIFSLDEAFLDLTECLPFLYPNPMTAARELQRRIFQELGEWVTCSIGISHTRLLAKMGSNMATKGSILHITEENKDSWLATARFIDVCGVGYRLEQRLKRWGITCPYHLRLFSEKELQVVVGSFWAKELQLIAYGQDPLFLQRLDAPPTVMKSVSRSITGHQPCSNETQIRATIMNLIEECSYKLQKMKLVGRHVSIYLSSNSGSFYRHVTLPEPLQFTPEIFAVLYDQLYRSWQRTFPIMKFAVGVSKLSPVGDWSIPLSTTWHKQHSLAKAMHTLSDKYGLFVVRPGNLLEQPLIRPEVTGFLGDRIYLGLN